MTANHERPFLYVLATQPSTPNQATTSEWIIELFKPPPTGLKPLSTVSQPKHSPSTSTSSTSKHTTFPSAFGPSHKTQHQQEESASTISPTASPSPSSQSTSQVPVSASASASVSASTTTPIQPSKPNETAPPPAPPAPPSSPQRSFFSRLHQGSSPSPSPSAPIILRIAVTSIPYQHSHQITSDLDLECTSALETVHTTPDSSSWLRQALLALQGKGVLPPVSHDFDVTKFIAVADDCLRKTLGTAQTQTQRKEDPTPREVRYWRVLRGLDDGADDGGDDDNVDDGEDGSAGGVGGLMSADAGAGGQARDWSLPHRERKSVAEKGAGSVVIGYDRKPWDRERGKAYGGLM